MRRAATSLTAVVLVLGLVGTCPCLLAGSEACSAMPSRPAADPAPCCQDPVPAAGLHARCCCGKPSPADTPIVSPAFGLPGPASIADLGATPSASSLAASLLTGASHHPPPPRLGGLLVLRI